MNLRKAAEKFAKMAHKGQKRRNGKDYYTEHIEKVVTYLLDNQHCMFRWTENNYWIHSHEHFECVVAAAYLHDVLEDTKYTKEDLCKKFPQMTIDLVDILTRKRGETYYDFIWRIMESGSLSVSARAIKLADLRCNMEDLGEGSMKDKYRFAAYILGG